MRCYSALAICSAALVNPSIVRQSLKLRFHLIAEITHTPVGVVAQRLHDAGHHDLKGSSQESASYGGTLDLVVLVTLPIQRIGLALPLNFRRVRNQSTGLQ